MAKQTTMKKNQVFELPKTSMESCKYVFSVDEIRRISAEMAEHDAQAVSLKDDLKEMQTQFKANITSAENQRTAAGQKIRSGYEYRGIECKQEVWPVERVVKYIRIDTLEEVKTRKATEDDLQMDLPLNG